MIKSWLKLLDADCIVIKIGTDTIYPIFRNGSTSLIADKNESYVNDQIKSCSNIQVLIRDPEVRFASGINEYSRQHNLSVEQTWHSVSQGDIVDRHFAPQYVWLFHLYKFYKGTVTLRPFEHIKHFTSLHRVAHDYRVGKFKKKEIVNSLYNFVDPDYQLTKYMNHEVLLGEILKECKNVLS